LVGAAGSCVLGKVIASGAWKMDAADSQKGHKRFLRRDGRISYFGFITGFRMTVFSPMLRA
jgi:hypothetical protein